MMQIGRLNRRVQIQQQDIGQDDFGQEVTTWTDVVKVWANILSTTGKETISGARDVSIVMTSIRIRYREDVTAAMRVVHGSKIYNIEAVLPDDADRRYLDLVASIGANDG